MPFVTPFGLSLSNAAPIVARPVIEARKRRSFLQRYGRLILLVVGALSIFALVSAIGPAKIWGALKGAGVWLPLILALDFSWLFFEHLAVRVLLKKDAAKVPLRLWMESTLLHYATFMVVPMGRTSAEVTRASMLSKHVGKAQAATVAAIMQSLTMVANALVSAWALLVLVFVSSSHALVVGLSANIAVTSAIGVGTYLVMRHVRLGGFLGKRFSKLADAGPEMDVYFRESRDRHWGALGICVTARLIQTAQFGVIVLAVTGTSSLSLALLAEGIQLVGRSAGDMVPNQVGITEGAFTLFADALSLQDSPEKAVSLALLARISNLTVAGACAVALQLRSRHVQATA